MNSFFVTLQVQPLGIWTYIFLAILVAVEGPITTLAGAVASSAGYLDPFLVFVSASCGNLTADVLWYSVGYLGKREWLGHYGGWFGVKEKMIDHMQKDMEAHIKKILFTAKLTLGFVVPTLIAAGLAKISWRRWFGPLFLAECMWTGSLVLVGHYFGQYVLTLERGLEWVSLGGAAVFVILLIAYVARRRSAETEGK